MDKGSAAPISETLEDYTKAFTAPLWVLWRLDKNALQVYMRLVATAFATNWRRTPRFTLTYLCDAVLGICESTALAHLATLRKLGLISWMNDGADGRIITFHNPPLREPQQSTHGPKARRAAEPEAVLPAALTDLFANAPRFASCPASEALCLEVVETPPSRHPNCTVPVVGALADGSERNSENSEFGGNSENSEFSGTPVVGVVYPYPLMESEESEKRAGDTTTTTGELRIFRVPEAKFRVPASFFRVPQDCPDSPAPSTHGTQGIQAPLFVSAGGMPLSDEDRNLIGVLGETLWKVGNVWSDLASEYAEKLVERRVDLASVLGWLAKISEPGARLDNPGGVMKAHLNTLLKKPHHAPEPAYMPLHACRRCGRVLTRCECEHQEPYMPAISYCEYLLGEHRSGSSFLQDRWGVCEQCGAVPGQCDCAQAEPDDINWDSIETAADLARLLASRGSELADALGDAESDGRPSRNADLA